MCPSPPGSLPNSEGLFLCEVRGINDFMKRTDVDPVGRRDARVAQQPAHRAARQVSSTPLKETNRQDQACIENEGG